MNVATRLRKEAPVSPSSQSYSVAKNEGGNLDPNERAKQRTARIRLTLDISENLNDRLDEIAADSGMPKTEILRKAIVAIDAIYKAHIQGKRVGIASINQPLETAFLIF